MELHPTPESWRIALFTAFGAAVIAAGGVGIAAGFRGSVAVIILGTLVVLAGLATFAPAVGTLSATVDADTRGVSVRRFGRVSRYSWADVADVRVIVRRASVPDGTEYHWVFPNRRSHVVAVPCLQLADGRVRELPALAAPATGPRSTAATEHAYVLERLRAVTSTSDEALNLRTA
jgi:hypothetical protein